MIRKCAMSLNFRSEIDHGGGVMGRYNSADMVLRNDSEYLQSCTEQ